MDIERWLPVVGYEHLYEVSDAGRVRSLPRRVQCIRGTRISNGRMLKTGHAKYCGVTLFNNGRCETHAVHRLVLLAFCGDPPAGTEACHWNGDPHDNRLINLRWDSRAANRNDGKRLGEISLGEKRTQSKLTPADIQQIRDRAARGEPHLTIAADFPVHAGTIGKIVRRELWRHIR